VCLPPKVDFWIEPVIAILRRISMPQIRLNNLRSQVTSTQSLQYFGINHALFEEFLMIALNLVQFVQIVHHDRAGLSDSFFGQIGGPIDAV